MKTTNENGSTHNELDVGNIMRCPCNPHSIVGGMMSVGKPKYFVFHDNNHDGVSSPSPSLSRFHARDIRPPRPPPPPVLTVPEIHYAAERVIGCAHAHPRPSSAIDYPAAASQQQRRAGGGGPRQHTAASTSAATEYLCAPPVCCLLGPYRWSVHVTRARIFF